MDQPTHGVLTARSKAYNRNADKPHFVYELWSDRECLYVGMTINVGARLTAHTKQPWWRYVADVKARRYGHRDDAWAEEAATIARYQPRHNIQLTDGPTERRLARR